MKVASISSLTMSTLLHLCMSVHQARATCTIKPLNKAFQGLTVDVYDGQDGVCWATSDSDSMDYDTFSYLTCQGSSCKIKQAGANNCDGTVDVACDMFIVYYLTNGNLNYCISSDEFCEDSRRQLSSHPDGGVPRHLRRGAQSVAP